MKLKDYSYNLTGSLSEANIIFDKDYKSSFLKNDVKEDAHTQGIYDAINLLLHLFKDNEIKMEPLGAFAFKYEVLNKRGNALEVFQKHLIPNMAINFKEFVAKLIKAKINEHVSVAYAKMGNGEKNLLKFIIEDNCLILIETVNPNFTNPRLKTLYNFCRDLQMVSQEVKVTEYGHQVITEIEAAYEGV